MAETPNGLNTLTITEAAALLRRRMISPVELTEACLAKIGSLDETVNAFITVTAESALESARVRQDEISRGKWRGPLHGIPIALKDLIDTAGVRTTAASALFANRIPKRDAEIVRLLRQSGAVVIGKTNLHEFAYGGSSIVSHFGPVRNPRNPDYIAGGSSGGSAAAVASGMCLGAIGTDTAGSIRVPAAYCGVVGLKPTYGTVSVEGVIPLAQSFDHVGPLARTAADARILLSAISGHNPADEEPMRSKSDTDFKMMSTLRIGVVREMFGGAEAEVVECVEEAVRRLAEFVREVRDVAVDVEESRTASNYESFAYHKEYVAESPELYDSSTLARIRLGEKITAAEYDTAKKQLQKVRSAVDSIFMGVDVVISPTVPILPMHVDELQQHPEELRNRELMMLRNTRPFNVLGIPAISVPCGKSSAGLPIGIQIAANTGREDLVAVVGEHVMTTL